MGSKAESRHTGRPNKATWSDGLLIKRSAPREGPLVFSSSRTSFPRSPRPECCNKVTQKLAEKRIHWRLAKCKPRLFGQHRAARLQLATSVDFSWPTVQLSTLRPLYTCDWARVLWGKMRVKSPCLTAAGVGCMSVESPAKTGNICRSACTRQFSSAENQL